MVQQSEVTSGWLKTKNGARYANVSQRTFRDWFKEGLRHVRLPSGTILVKADWIDAYLDQFEVTQGEDEVDRIVGELAGELGG
jgi:hypothetical protein